MNNENLIRPSSEEARENGKKGGIKSGQVRRSKKTLKELVKMFGTMPVTGDAEKAMEKLGIPKSEQNRYMQSVISLFGKAAKGDVGAFNAIRDIIGEKPKDEMNIDVPTTLRVEIVGEETEFPSSEDEIEE